MEEGVAGGALVTLPNLMMTTETADHWDGLAFGFGLAQSGITRIHKRFWVLLFYFSTYYTPLQLVLSHLLIFSLWSFGFSVILSVPKTCARLCSYQRVGVDRTGRGRMGLYSAAGILRFDSAPLKQRTKFLFIH